MTRTEEARRRISASCLKCGNEIEDVVVMPILSAAKFDVSVFCDHCGELDMAHVPFLYVDILVDLNKELIICFGGRRSPEFREREFVEKLAKHDVASLIWDNRDG